MEKNNPFLATPNARLMSRHATNESLIVSFRVDADLKLKFTQQCVKQDAHGPDVLKALYEAFGDGAILYKQTKSSVVLTTSGE